MYAEKSNGYRESNVWLIPIFSDKRSTALKSIVSILCPVQTIFLSVLVKNFRLIDSFFTLLRFYRRVIRSNDWKVCKAEKRMRYSCMNLRLL